MDEKNSQKAVQEIEEKRKLPKSEKEGIDKAFFKNNVMAIGIMAYFILINLSYIYLSNQAFERFLKWVAMAMLIATITVFEIAYKKDDFKIALIGIELLICGLLSIYIPYIFLYTSPIYRKIMMIIPIFFAAYYIAKTIAVYILKEIKHKNNLSDVKEIIKYSENKSYIDEESTKILKEDAKRKEEEKRIKKEKAKAGKTNSSTKNSNSKSTSSKKQVAQNSDVKNKKVIIKKDTKNKSNANIKKSVNKNSNKTENKNTSKSKKK